MLIHFPSDPNSRSTTQPLSTAHWVVEFEFRVHGHGTRLFGDGFAFWFVTDRNVRGSIYGSKDNFNGLGVFFDTYANGRQSVRDLAGFFFKGQRIFALEQFVDLGFLLFFVFDEILAAHPPLR
jgi:hypothetical protein